MFDIGWGELLLIAVVALIAIGPKELPGALRTLGQWMGKIRRMAGEFQNQFQDAMREAELHELKKEVDEMASTARSYTNFNPLDDVRKDIESAVGELPPLHEPQAESATASVTTTSSEMPATAPAPAADVLVHATPTTEVAPPVAASTEHAPAAPPTGTAATDAGKTAA
jgi:sec-independent protein translocase protein TatB